MNCFFFCTQAEHQPKEDTNNEALSAHFTAVLHACNYLTSEIIFVHNQLFPCFPPYCAFKTLWNTCVAMVVS